MMSFAETATFLIMMSLVLAVVLRVHYFMVQVCRHYIKIEAMFIIIAKKLSMDMKELEIEQDK